MNCSKQNNLFSVQCSLIYLILVINLIIQNSLLLFKFSFVYLFLAMNFLKLISSLFKLNSSLLISLQCNSFFLFQSQFEVNLLIKQVCLLIPCIRFRFSSLGELVHLGYFLPFSTVRTAIQTVCPVCHSATPYRPTVQSVI